MVVKHGSLVNAAEKRCISQPAVSKGINQLKADHGVDLLEKHGKKLIPTDAGIGTYDIAAQIFGLEKKAESLLRRHLNEQAALISIHVSETFGSYFLPLVFKKFTLCLPYLQIRQTSTTRYPSKRAVCRHLQQLPFSGSHPVPSWTPAILWVPAEIVPVAPPQIRRLPIGHPGSIPMTGESVLRYRTGSRRSRNIQTRRRYSDGRPGAQKKGTL